MKSKSTQTLSVDNVRTDINQLLSDYLSNSIARSQQMDENYTYLWQAIESLVNAGGKRLRPYLLMLAYSGYGGQDNKKIMPIAAAQELLHVSLLIHDDIIDNDYVRHGQDNVMAMMQKKYQRQDDLNAIHFAEAAAILAGDLLISGAHNLIVESEIADNQKLTALKLLSNGIFAVGGGELLDMESVMLPFKTTDTLKIAELKTAGYSFTTPLLTGAKLAGANDQELDILEQLAISLGIGFQLADDILGVFGEETVMGKSNLSDIREGKRTYLMSQAFSLANQEQIKTLEKLVGNPNVTQSQADDVRFIIEDCGAKTAVHQKINDYVTHSNNLLDKLSMSDKSKSALRSFIKQATDRSI